MKKQITIALALALLALPAMADTEEHPVIAKAVWFTTLPLRVVYRSAKAVVREGYTAYRIIRYKEAPAKADGEAWVRFE